MCSNFLKRLWKPMCNFSEFGKDLVDSFVGCHWLLLVLLPFYFSRLSIHPFQSKTLLLLSELFLLLRSCLKVTATFSSAVVALLVPQNWIAVVVISRHKDLPAASFNMKTTFLSSQGFQHLTIHMHQKNAWLYTAKSFQAFLLQNWAN